MAECERDFLRRCETIFAIENHRMRAVKHNNGRTGRLIIALMHVQVLVLEVQRHVEAFALNRGVESRVNVEIDRIAEFVRLTGSFWFYLRGEMRSVVAAH